MMTPPNGSNTITFTEVDEANNPVTEFIYSKLSPQPKHVKNRQEGEINGRIDIAHSSAALAPWSVKSLQNLLIDVFLPAGYPHSVSDDYVSYQIYDSLQAFSSSIAGLLSSRAVLQGVGVGNANASPTSALLLHILQDTSGRIATILFAHRVGTALEPECKMYRFAADIFNDLAMVLDCLSPMIPAGFSRVTVLSAAGVLRALCGVAGGGSKASLSAHFARWGNLAEVNAVGSLVVSYITSFTGTWLTLLLLLASHLSLNYAAVRSVQMTTLNRQRANIVFSTLLSSDPDFIELHNSRNSSSSSKPKKSHPKREEEKRHSVLTPTQVAKQERIFDANGTLKWYSSFPEPQPPDSLGTCQVGVTLHQFLSSPSPTSSKLRNGDEDKNRDNSYTSPRFQKTTLPLTALATLFANEEYVLSITPVPDNPRSLRVIADAKVLLRPSSTSNSQLKAWMHALLVARVTSSWSTSAQDTSLDWHTDVDIVSVLARTLDFLNESARFEGYIRCLGECGWDVDVEGGVSALETKVGRRVVVSF
ncbi:vitamin B6 photo-protection and homoeostasis-domain-containing protein [Aspergillus californicus]